MNGVILYKGPSQLDGEPIVVIATGLKTGSNNRKTGNLIQTWILREDISPVEAVKSGEDSSICGDCIHRGHAKNGKNTGRSCYVTVFQAPLTIWKSHKRGGYRLADDLPNQFTGRAIRIGSYGDPAAVPLAIWQAVCSGASYWTGYTHQWRDCDIGYSAYCMASADGLADRQFANMLGYRVFRVTADGDKASQEVICPASSEAGHKTTCDKCRACGGTSSRAKADIVITVHGAAGKVNAYQERTL